MLKLESRLTCIICWAIIKRLVVASRKVGGLLASNLSAHKVFVSSKREKRSAGAQPDGNGFFRVSLISSPARRSEILTSTQLHREIPLCFGAVRCSAQRFEQKHLQSPTRRSHTVPGLCRNSAAPQTERVRVLQPRHVANNNTARVPASGARSTLDPNPNPRHPSRPDSELSLRDSTARVASTSMWILRK